MIDINKLLESKSIEISFTQVIVDKNFVKSFRKENNLTQAALANIIGVTKKTIEKWEQGVNKVGGSSAVLLKLLNDNPELISQLYQVKDVSGKKSEVDEFEPIASTTIETISKSHKTPIIAFPMVAMFGWR